MLTLHNTLSRQLEEFSPISKDHVSLYTCGPTVYDFAHIGNLRTYIFEDVLRRSLEYNGYKVSHAMNITDVGHLVGDGDDGEDKMEVGAKREGRHPLEIAREYEAQFFKDLGALNILPPHEVLRATDSITEQIELIKILEEKGFTYKDELAIYFDTSKLPDYGKLSGQKLSDKKTGARQEVVIDVKKKNPQDFVLWFFLAGKYANHVLQWPSPWGPGFPGWHIECSAISKKLLGQPFDIHTGGVDHIGTHHTNEIAQSEAAFGQPLANFWLHGEFLLIDAGRMGKSENNAFTLKTLTDKNYSPLAYRYLCLSAHYRTQLNFTWESLQASSHALEKLYDFVRNTSETVAESGCAEYEELFTKAIDSDLNTAQALSYVWQMLNNSNYSDGQKLHSLFKFDGVLGLGLKNLPALVVPAEVQELLDQRQTARDTKNFATSDKLRIEIEISGFELMDTPEGQKLKKK